MLVHIIVIYCKGYNIFMVTVKHALHRKFLIYITSYHIMFRVEMELVLFMYGLLEMVDKITILVQLMDMYRVYIL